MKKLIALTMTLVIMLSLVSLSSSAITAGSTDVDVWDGTTAAGFSSGSGLQNDPYIIKTGAELDLLASTCYGGDTYADTYFRLEADIDWGGNMWTPIGYDNKHLFSGHFDGNGQTIYNLECFEVYAGIFGAVKEGSVKNLKVDYATFTTDDRFAGGICAWIKLGSVEGVSSGENVIVQTADIISRSAQMGGCFGYVHSTTVEGATFYGTVNCTTVPDTSFVGGIAGVVGGGASMKYCINRGSVNNINPAVTSGKVCYLGGIAGGIGATEIGTIEYCINYGEVSSADLAGGILGRVHVADSVMKNCYNLGSVKGVRVGAVLGYVAKTYVMEGNMGVALGDAYKAIGDEVGSSDPAYKSPTDSNLQVASETVITSQAGFSDADGQTAILVPIFNLVNPVEKIETTEPETTESPETPAPETTKEPETEAPATTEEVKTDAPTLTEAPVVTEAPTVTEPPKSEGGCGGSVALAAVILCILPVAIISKKH